MINSLRYQIYNYDTIKNIWYNIIYEILYKNIWTKKNWDKLYIMYSF